MAVSGKRAYELLERIGFERVSGTAEEKRAAEMLLEEARAIGAQGELLPFEVADAVVSSASLTVLEPYQKSYEVTAYLRSADTGDQGITADFLYVEDALPANLTNAKGKIVLINGRLVYDTYKALMKAGVRGVIGYSGALNDKLEETDLDIRKLREQLTEDFGATAALNIRAADALELVRDKASTVRIVVRNENVALTSHNVIATLPGTAHPDEVISFGAHYDSLVFSRGVYDNGSGSVILMELLRHFHENPPARTLKFLWYGSEEQGLLGSKAFVDAHLDELKNHRLMINVDVAGPVLGTEQCVVMGENSLVNYVDSMMRELGYPVKVQQDIYSSDSIPFSDNGVPAVNFMRDGAPGAAYIHCRYDRMDFLSADALQSTADVVLAFADRAINAKVFPIERKVPTEITEKIDKYLKKNAKDAE